MVRWAAISAQAFRCSIWNGNPLPKMSHSTKQPTRSHASCLEGSSSWPWMQTEHGPLCKVEPVHWWTWDQGPQSVFLLFNSPLHKVSVFSGIPQSVWFLFKAPKSKRNFFFKWVFSWFLSLVFFFRYLCLFFEDFHFLFLYSVNQGWASAVDISLLIHNTNVMYFSYQKLPLFFSFYRLSCSYAFTRATFY